MASNLKTNNKAKRRTASPDSFIEALRNLGSGVVDSIAHDVVTGIPQEAINQATGKRSGELKPNQSVNFDELKEKREKQAWNFQQEFLNLHRQEKLIWTHQEQETKLQIAAILEELKKLAQATKNLAKEVEIAAEQVPVEPGVYHLSFFEKLRQSILLFRKKVQESAAWLEAFNHRAKRRNYYWVQVRKSGTKFMLSQERYMATQAG